MNADATVATTPVTVTAECQKCEPTGLYKGPRERGNTSVVCEACRGTGSVDLSYTPFTGRKPPRHNTTLVLAANINMHLDDEDAAITAAQWQADPTAVLRPHAAPRNKYCPAFWHQLSNQSALRPNWLQCVNAGTEFTRCLHWQEKEHCWARFDIEYPDHALPPKFHDGATP